MVSVEVESHREYGHNSKDAKTNPPHAKHSSAYGQQGQRCHAIGHCTETDKAGDDSNQEPGPERRIFQHRSAKREASQQRHELGQKELALKSPRQIVVLRPQEKPCGHQKACNSHVQLRRSIPVDDNQTSPESRANGHCAKIIHDDEEQAAPAEDLVFKKE